MANPIQFIKEVRSELSKVVWPSRRVALRITFAVILFSIVVALFLGAADYALNYGFEQIVSK